VRKHTPAAADSRSEQECGCRPTVAPLRTSDEPAAVALSAGSPVEQEAHI